MYFGNFLAIALFVAIAGLVMLVCAYFLAKQQDDYSGKSFRRNFLHSIIALIIASFVAIIICECKK